MAAWQAREPTVPAHSVLMMNEVIFMIETPVEASRLERLGEPFAASETALTSIPFKSFLND
ncbi:hypothetical protein DFS30_00070 [Akkermansia muciniphila]|jgi:hypothetical protein|nr:hypothetical protein CXU08_02285 [Akkermansia muciniphila]PNC75196.1 hypothetical protein CXU02_05370 [Akkermansia muciniphila]PNC76924.1 hypothetical protein CXT98_07335 [Akkermansia muciniphila]PNC86320.1 hypothetical protein CXT97_07490 [Akkermansia muciniphila]PNC93790.1 hypothetical protein CXT89_08730 [Akkermansia muciniphila]